MGKPRIRWQYRVEKVPYGGGYEIRKERWTPINGGVTWALDDMYNDRQHPWYYRGRDMRYHTMDAAEAQRVLASLIVVEEARHAKQSI